MVFSGMKSGMQLLTVARCRRPGASHLVQFLLMAAALVPALGYAQADGPRVYQIVPDGTRVLSAYGIVLQGNQTADPGAVVRNGETDVTLGVLQYIQAVGIREKQAALFAVLPYGDISGKIDTPVGRIKGSTSGLGDLQLGAVFNLIGPPLLSREEYAKYPPDFTFGILAKLFMPTGSYDEGKVLNVGANRWSMQLGAPMAWYFGRSFLDPSLTTIELLPSVAFFSDNKDPFGASKTGQDPLFRLEGHLTRNLHRAVWVSLDMLYVYGGETTTNGRDDNNGQRALELGGSANLTFSPRFSIKMSYGEVVARNDDGPDGNMFRVVGTCVF